VGSVVASCLAFLDRQVVGLEIDPRKLSFLQRGRAPSFEPGLEDLLSRGLASRRLSFTDNVSEAVQASDVVFFCVGTPQGGDGKADMSAFYSAAVAVGGALRHHHVLVNKSTVPVGTGRLLAAIVEDSLSSHRAPSDAFSVVSCPEFLREGNAVEDFLRPHRVVLGSDNATAIDKVADVYRPILEQSYDGGNALLRPALVRTSLVNAEMIKYASNAFLATKISFINEIANICDLVGADVTEVAATIGFDPRIGGQFLDAGPGWGGSCFGKDLHALVRLATDRGYQPQLLQATLGVNQRQRWSIVEKLLSHLRTLQGKHVALLGLAFKPGTDDLRDSPAVDVAGWLLSAGSRVSAHDPMVHSVPGLPDLEMSPSAYRTAAGADALVLLTDWPEYRALDLTGLREVMNGDVLIDARNLLDPGAAVRAGFVYEGVGRPVQGRANQPAREASAARTIWLEERLRAQPVNGHASPAMDDVSGNVIDVVARLGSRRSSPGAELLEWRTDGEAVPQELPL
jgi:nucleotide sugar dehydrogenase